MEFCPKCGAILMMKGKGFGCPRCNYVTKNKIKMEIKEKVDAAKPVAVISEKDGSIHPITDWDCKKCNSKRAYFWIQQMRAGDEAESKFYKCVKCGHTVRVDN